ncbi:MAG TPA: dephospho-CoA kinase [Pararhizobium sp.]|nr:dephospho-CoA kinase [Pararhizobium sp.]
MIVLGLTGSIGMGKSVTTRLFSEEGVPTASADEIVHALYAGKAAPLIEAAFPGTMKGHTVDRIALSTAVLDDPQAMQRLESIIHPLVRVEEQAFVERQRAAGRPLALIDIPLLFETGAETRVDKIVVVSCAPALQRARVLARPGMTVEKFEAILAHQLSDEEKRARADFVIETDHGIEPARTQVRRIVETLRKEARRED